MRSRKVNTHTHTHKHKHIHTHKHTHTYIHRVYIYIYMLFLGFKWLTMVCPSEISTYIDETNKTLLWLMQQYVCQYLIWYTTMRSIPQKKNLYDYPLMRASTWNDILLDRTYHTVVVASTLIRNVIHWTDAHFHETLWQWREKSVSPIAGVLCCVARCDSVACDCWQYSATDQASTWSRLAMRSCWSRISRNFVTPECSVPYSRQPTTRF